MTAPEFGHYRLRWWPARWGRRRIPAVFARVPLWSRLVLAALGLAAVGLTVTGLVGINLFRAYLLDQSGQQLLTEAHTISSGHWDKPTYQALNCGNVPNDNAVEMISDVDGASTLSSCDATVDQSTVAPARPSAVTLFAATESGQPITQTSRVGSVTVDWQIAVVRARFQDVTDTTEHVAPPDSAALGDDAATHQETAPVGATVGGYVLVATPLDNVDATVSHLVDLDIVVDAAVGLALLGLGHLLVRRTLLPLRRIESAAVAISAGDLTRRVPHGHPKTEIGRLSVSLNGMLGKIESSFAAQTRSEAAALRSEARMRRFVADAGHELRTPLASVRGITELYRQGAVGPEQVAEVMGRIEGEATRMGLLVEDLLLLARLDQQRPLARDPVHLAALAADSVIAARARASDRSIELLLDPPAEPSGDAEEGFDGVGEPIVIGDEGRLRQALDNLLTNAVHHTPAGTPVSLRVRPADASGHCVLEVTDTGPGLSAEDAAHAFERFYRSDRSRARRSGAHQGSGLGLAIVAAIAQAHGGSASVRSEPGRGACFALRLPAAQVRRGRAGTWEQQRERES
ncbi:HAMP domain-containing histidine kinase [Actinospica durhamensis]|uniref:histidine kinase n=1 Tax=Actinospica durhamensis TaxID=1508375 RepID=A0A941EM57_9ACTN|nr:HAMP domain-containing sensor histidine kinase [Actinospica durhamensis]MBR7832908.1 HAMP domain-containing histidine kinase [Actinospica durhamensis]